MDGFWDEFAEEMDRRCPWCDRRFCYASYDERCWEREDDEATKAIRFATHMAMREMVKEASGG